jgi:L-alanine-DL-glutamate epimerase-like enolase superfamily enzyme
MERRKFLGSALLLSAYAGRQPVPLVDATVSDMKIKKIRIYNPTGTSGVSGWLNHSAIVVTVETDAGITGVGQGGTKDTLEDCAGALINQDPLMIPEHFAY